MFMKKTALREENFQEIIGALIFSNHPVNNKSKKDYFLASSNNCHSTILTYYHS